jgi:hypothetical protein
MNRRSPSQPSPGGGLEERIVQSENKNQNENKKYLQIN